MRHKPGFATRFTFGIVACAFALAALGLVLIGTPGQAQSDQSVLARVVSRVLSTPSARVQIGDIEGALSSDATIRNLRISDSEGVWLSVDSARLVWSRTALLRGRLQVDLLEIGRVEMARRQTPSAEADALAPEGEQPLLPEIPVKVIVDRFSLKELALAEPVLGAAARLSAEGRASLGDPSEGLDLNFRATRLDAPGRFAAQLAYAPQTNNLKLDLDFDEPAGGLAARLLDLPDLPPVSLKLAGQGPLTDFASRLDFQAGETIGANGEARVARAADAYRITLGLSARIAGLLPGAVAPVFQGSTQLDGEVVARDSGAVDVNRLRLASPVAALDVSGRLTADRQLDVRVSGRALPNADGGTKAGATEIDKLALDLFAKGALDAPRVWGAIEAAGVRTSLWSLASLDGKVDVTSVAGDVTKGVRFEAQATADGLKLADRALGRAVGESVNITARGAVDEKGVATVEVARIATPTANAAFSGRVGARVVDGKLSARVPSLAPLSDLAGQRLRGAARFEAALTGDPRMTVDARIDGAAEDFGSANAALDGLLGESVTLNGLVRRTRGGFELEGVRLSGANLDARATGRTTQAAMALDVTLEVPELKRLDPRVDAGRLHAEAHLAGDRTKPEFVATAELTDVRALQRPIPRLEVDLRGALGDAFEARLALDGQMAGKPVTGSGRLTRPDGGWLVEGLKLAAGSVGLEGRVRVAKDGLAEGRASVKAGDLDDVSPLVLTRLGGRLVADLSLSAPQGRQRVEIDANGAGLRFGDARLRDLTAALDARDVFGAPVVDGRVVADEASVGGETFRDLRLVAKGGADSTRFTANARARDFALSAQGAASTADEGRRIALEAFEARRAGRRIALASPATITLTPQGPRIAGLELAVDGGRLSVEGLAGETLDLELAAKRLPLAAAEIFAPGLGLAGTLEARASLTGPRDRPTGSYTIAAAGLATRQTRDAGLAPMTVKAQGTLADGRASVKGAVEAPGAGRLTIAGSAPLAPNGALDLSVEGRVDLRVANSSLAGSGRRVAGAANVDLRVRGTAAKPDVAGDIRIAGGSFQDPLQGVQLTAIEARLAARGDALTIESASARTPKGGTLSASGRISIDPQAGFPGDLRISGKRAQLASNAMATAVADLDLTLSGPLARAPRVAGRVELLTLDVTIPDRIAATRQPLPGARHIAPPPQAKARLAAKREAAPKGPRAPVFDAALDLTVAARNRIFVRGRGVDAELGGDLRLTGSTSQPVAIGAFELRRGRLDLLGQRLSFTRGRLDFSGDLTPTLDFVAETTAGDVTARIAVTGPASQPEFQISSSPDLPQDEVISRILFQRAAGGLSAGQALQLAQAVAMLSGGSGSGAFEQIRKSLGVDSLDITTGASGGPAVSASRYISDRVRVGVKAGARPEESGVTVDVDLSRRLKLQSQVDGDGSSSVGVGFEWEY